MPFNQFSKLSQLDYNPFFNQKRNSNRFQNNYQDFHYIPQENLTHQSKIYHPRTSTSTTTTTTTTTISTSRGQTSTTKTVYSLYDLFISLQHQQSAKTHELKNDSIKQCKMTRHKTKFSSEQLSILNYHFQRNHYLSNYKYEMLILSRITGLSILTIRNWFSRKRTDLRHLHLMGKLNSNNQYKVKRGTNLRQFQLSTLQEHFKRSQVVTKEDKRKLSTMTGLSDIEVRNWFYIKRKYCVNNPQINFQSNA